MKRLTFDQVADRKEKAVRFVENVLDDVDRAAEIEDESIEHYAERRRIEIISNPNATGDSEMPEPTKDDLYAQISDLERENEELNRRLDDIGEIIAPEEEEEQGPHEEEYDYED